MKTEQIDSLYKVCPGAMEAVEDYLDSHIRSIPNGVAELEALKKQFGDGKKSAARIMLATGDRFLYEFLDSNGIYVVVRPFYVLPGSEVRWVIEAYDFPTNQSFGGEGEPFLSRQQAEAVAFGKGLKILESKLG